jgi:hypothetical protein
MFPVLTLTCLSRYKKKNKLSCRLLFCDTNSCMIKYVSCPIGYSASYILMRNDA